MESGISVLSVVPTARASASSTPQPVILSIEHLSLSAAGPVFPFPLPCLSQSAPLTFLAGAGPSQHCQDINAISAVVLYVREN